MSKKILNRDEAILIMENSIDNEVFITQAEAANLLGVKRQRVGQYVRHPEHSISLGVVTHEGKTKLSLSKVLTFQRRSEYRGKRGKQKKIKPVTEITSV